jgi:hypothetical protein
MSKLWVKFKHNNATRVSTEGCQVVDDFLEACKKKLCSKLGSYDVDQISLCTTDGGTPFQPDDPLPAENTAKTPLFISVAVLEKEIVSMFYEKATIPFINEATGVEDEIQLWENIPVDTTVEPSQKFVELFKKSCYVFEFGTDASRRIMIDLFLQEVVAQFPDFVIICDYNMTLVNETKRRRLSGKCDYTICHRGHRNFPHLVAIEAKMTNTETLLQCIGECASIHYRRKLARMKNLCVYGIHSTGSCWKFVFIDEDGSLFESREYFLNPERYVKEGFDLIYRLVYYVVEKTHLNSPRTTPSESSASINQ